MDSNTSSSIGQADSGGISVHAVAISVEVSCEDFASGVSQTGSWSQSTASMQLGLLALALASGRFFQRRKISWIGDAGGRGGR